MIELTERQQEVYQFILQHQKDTGSLPTCNAIAKHFGFKSDNGAQEHVNALRRKGYIAPQKEKKGRMQLMRVES